MFFFSIGREKNPIIPILIQTILYCPHVQMCSLPFKNCALSHPFYIPQFTTAYISLPQWSSSCSSEPTEGIKGNHSTCFSNSTSSPFILPSCLQESIYIAFQFKANTHSFLILTNDLLYYNFSVTWES